MSDVQLAIIDQQNTDVTIAVPGIQGIQGQTGDVAVAQDGTQGTPGIRFENDPDTGIYRPGANQLALSTNGTGRVQFGTSEVVFNDDGNNYDFRIEGDTVSNLFFVDASADKVGIGTSAPQALLHLSSETGSSTPTPTELRIATTTSSSTWSISSPWGRISFYSADGTYLGPKTQGTIDIIASDSLGGTSDYDFKLANTTGALSSVMRVTAAGNVGIGTTNVDELLHVESDGATPKIKVESTLADSSPGFRVTNDARSYDIRIDGTNDNLQFYDATASQGRVAIDSSGRLLVGTVSSPAYKLQLETDSAGKPSTNTWTIVSDERIKEEIELADLDLCYEAVKNIPLKRFKWKDEVYTEEQAYDRRKLGWIAQDVEAVFPKAVRQHEFRYNQVFEEVVIPAVPAELDDDGNIITEEQPERIEKGELISEEVIEDCRDLNSDQLYAAMYGAIQKLISKVELLEAEVQALKAA